MNKIEKFETVQATTGEYARPKADGYIVKIINVTDMPLDVQTSKGDYLKIDYDICDGEFANYYTEQQKRLGGKWFANFIRSYKEKALGMFKHFINCVEESNNGFVWTWDEDALIGKKVGVVLGEEEYLKNDGSVGTKLVVKNIKTVKQIADGDFIVPVKKTIEVEKTPLPEGFEEIIGDIVPF